MWEGIEHFDDLFPNGATFAEAIDTYLDLAKEHPDYFDEINWLIYGEHGEELGVQWLDRLRVLYASLEYAAHSKAWYLLTAATDTPTYVKEASWNIRLGWAYAASGHDRDFSSEHILACFAQRCPALYHDPNDTFAARVRLTPEHDRPELACVCPPAVRDANWDARLALCTNDSERAALAWRGHADILGGTWENRVAATAPAHRVLLAQNTPPVLGHSKEPVTFEMRLALATTPGARQAIASGVSSTVPGFTWDKMVAELPDYATRAVVARSAHYGIGVTLDQRLSLLSEEDRKKYGEKIKQEVFMYESEEVTNLI